MDGVLHDFWNELGSQRSRSLGVLLGAHR
eukprot:COSAG06_NODE_64870_length_258_cov_0.905660_1_plen_28_part_10